MTLSITSNLNYDEALGFNSTDVDSDTDSNVSSLSTDLASAISSLSLNYYTAPTNFPQYAEMTNFATTNQSVTSYFLASDSSGDAFSTTTGVGTTLMVGSNEIFLYATSDPNVVVGRVGSGTTANASGSVALVIALGGSVSSPELGVAVYAPIVQSGTNLVDDADTLNLSNLIYLGSHFTTSTETDFDSFKGVPSGSDAFAMILPDTANVMQLLVTGLTGSTEEPITISQDANAGSIGGGGGGQHVGPGNSIRIDTITGGDFSKADTASEDNNFANISYSHHQESFQASFQLVQVNPGTAGTATSLDIFAYDTSTNAQGTSFVTDALANEGTAVTINPANVHIYNASGTEITPAAGQITQNGAGVLITGLQFDYTVKFSTPGSQFDRFIVTNAQPTKGAGSNVTFDIGHIHVSTLTIGSGTDNTELGSHLIFEDGGPSVALTSAQIPTVTVDETTLGVAGEASKDFSGLFNPSYGPDGAGSLAYALGVSSSGANSGLVDTATGHGIFLYVDTSTGDVVGLVGSSTTTADPSGAEDFRISVDSTGNVTFEQSHAVVHSDPNASNESASMSSASLVTLTAMVSDSEGDTASSQAVNIGTSFSILDDEPRSLGTGSNVIVGNNLSASPPSPQLPDTGTGSFTTFNAGNDGLGSFTIVGPADQTGAYTWAYGADHSSIVESYTNPSTNQTETLFSLALDSSTGGYTMTMLHTLPFSQVNLDANNIKAGGPTGSIDVGTINDNGEYVQISGTYNNGTTGQVNASNGNVGVNNGNLDTGESLIFSLYSSTGTLIPVYGLDMGTKTAQGATYHLYGVRDSDHTTIDLGTQTLPKGGEITYSGTTLLDSIIVTDTSGNAVKIGLAGVHLLTPPDDAGFHFTAQLADGDGDTVSSSFNVFIDGNNDGTVDTAHVVFPA